MQGIAVVLYIVIALVQLAAIISGLMDWLDMNVFFALAISLIVFSFIYSFVPFVGPVLGVMGAMRGWGWEWWQAAILF